MTINCGRLTNNNIDAALKFLPVFEQEGYQFEEGFICNFNWPNWQAVAERYYRQPELLDQADLETVCRLLTTHVRKDRFCEGHLLCMLGDGHISAILSRLREIRKKMVDGQDKTG